MVQIHESWQHHLKECFGMPYMKNIKEQLTLQKEKGVRIYPRGSEIFNAFNLTPFDDVKVVILGQDPYHGPGQAHGLSFSVPDGITPPPSLKNMYKELRQSGQIDQIPTSGNLTHRAEQGVLLLNSILTVKAHQAASHRDLGRQEFTDDVISTISDQSEGTVFLLRGGFAKTKIPLIDTSKHHVLTTSHPSPLSAHRGFLGSGCFAKANELLEQQGKKPIAW